MDWNLQKEISVGLKAYKYKEKLHKIKHKEREEWKQSGSPGAYKVIPRCLIYTKLESSVWGWYLKKEWAESFKLSHWKITPKVNKYKKHYTMTL